MDHLHCQDCGAHFTNRAELDGHNCQPGEPCAQSGQRGELAADAAGGIQERPATEKGERRNRVFTRSPRE